MVSDLDLLKKYSKELTLLIVEDEEIALKLYKKRFGKLFKSVEGAENGEVALDKLKREKFDIILSDINMPRVNGISLTKKIRERDLEQTIVIISSYSESKYFIELINLGVDGFLLKPFDEEQAQKLLYKLSKANFEKKMFQLYLNQIEQESNFEDIEFSKVNIRESSLNSTKESLKSSKSLISRVGEREKISAEQFLIKIEFKKYGQDILEDIELLSEINSD